MLSIDILIVTPTPVFPQDAGNRVRIKRLLEQFSDLSLRWHLVYIRMEHGNVEDMYNAYGRENVSIIEPHRRKKALWKRTLELFSHVFLRKGFDLPYGVDDWCGIKTVRAVQRMTQDLNPKLVWIEYVFLSAVLEDLPKTVYKVIDTHDVFAGRHKMLASQGLKPQWFYTDKRNEAKGLLRAQCIVAIQQMEANFFQQYGCNVATVGHWVECQPLDPASRIHSRLIFIGSNNQVNQDAIQLLITDIFPRVRALIPTAHLAIYGNICKYCPDHVEGVLKMGFANQLETVYAEATVVLAPLRIGTGLKIKVIEALGYGKALVAFPSAVDGLPCLGLDAFLTAITVDNFVTITCRLLRDEIFRHRIETNALAYSRKWNNLQTQALRRVVLPHLSNPRHS